jgi:hypothetical protein
LSVCFRNPPITLLSLGTGKFTDVGSGVNADISGFFGNKGPNSSTKPSTVTDTSTESDPTVASKDTQNVNTRESSPALTGICDTQGYIRESSPVMTSADDKQRDAQPKIRTNNHSIKKSLHMRTITSLFKTRTVTQDLDFEASMDAQEMTAVSDNNGRILDDVEGNTTDAAGETLTGSLKKGFFASKKQKQNEDIQNSNKHHTLKSDIKGSDRPAVLQMMDQAKTKPVCSSLESHGARSEFPQGAGTDVSYRLGAEILHSSEINMDVLECLPADIQKEISSRLNLTLDRKSHQKPSIKSFLTVVPRCVKEVDRNSRTQPDVVIINDSSESVETRVVNGVEQGSVEPKLLVTEAVTERDGDGELVTDTFGDTGIWIDTDATQSRTEVLSIDAGGSDQTVDVCQPVAGSSSTEDYLPCEKCGHQVSVWDMPEHQDYHFALDLQNSTNERQTDDFPRTSNKRKQTLPPAGQSKRSKHSAVTNNKVLDSFFTSK